MCISPVTFQSDITLLIFFPSFAIMASSTNSKDIATFNTSNNPIAFQLTEEESLKPIPQPTSIDEAVVKI